MADEPLTAAEAETPKASRLNSAAPDFIPKQCTFLPPVSIDRTVSKLDAVKFSPANGVCTPTSTSCWVWDPSYGWYFSPNINRGSPHGSWSPHSVLPPTTPQQSSPQDNVQHQSDGSCSDSGIASDSSCFSSAGPNTPVLYHNSPFYWQRHAGNASPTSAAQLSPMSFPPNTAMQPGPIHQTMPHLPPMRGPPMHANFQPQMHMQYGMMPHGLTPLSIPPPPASPSCARLFLSVPAQPHPAYARQPGTPGQWQEQGPQWRGWQQSQGFATPMPAIRRTSRLSSGSQNTSPSSGAPAPSPCMVATPMLQKTNPRKRVPLQEVQQPGEAAEQTSGSSLLAHKNSSTSPTRKPNGITAEDTSQITAVLARAKLLHDNVPKEVEDLKALLSSEPRDMLNARQRRTLRRAIGRAAKALDLDRKSDRTSSTRHSFARSDSSSSEQSVDEADGEYAPQA